MSNCVEIRNPEVQIPPGVIDVALWRRRVDSKADDPIFYWFLAENHILYPDGSMTIRFGKGRSSHTWRDLYQTAMLLAEVATAGRPYRCVFQVADESDNFEAVESIGFAFGRDETGPWVEVGSRRWRLARRLTTVPGWFEGGSDPD